MSSSLKFEDAVRDFGDLSGTVQNHLTHVYAALFAGLLCASVGAYVDMFYLQMGGLLSTLAGILFLVLTMSTPNTKEYRTQRFLYFAGFCTLQGVSLGPILSFAMAVNEGIIFMALSGTSLIFLSFTISAHMSPRRSYLYLGGKRIDRLIGFWRKNFPWNRRRMIHGKKKNDHPAVHPLFSIKYSSFGDGDGDGDCDCD